MSGAPAAFATWAATVSLAVSTATSPAASAATMVSRAGAAPSIPAKYRPRYGAFEPVICTGSPIHRADRSRMRQIATGQRYRQSCSTEAVSLPRLGARTLGRDNVVELGGTQRLDGDGEQLDSAQRDLDGAHDGDGEPAPRRSGARLPAGRAELRIGSGLGRLLCAPGDDPHAAATRRGDPLHLVHHLDGRCSANRSLRLDSGGARQPGRGRGARDPLDRRS